LRRTVLPLFLMVLVLALPISIHQLPRHVDPAKVHEEAPSPLGLLSIYMRIASSVSAGSFNEALENLRTVFKIYAPEDLRYIFSRFNSLLQEEVLYLNETNLHLGKSRSLLNLGFLKEAEDEANEGSRTLAKAELIHNYDLLPASREFTRRIPIDLLSVLNPLNETIERYYIELRNLDLEINKKVTAGIEETTLQIRVNKSEAWVGSYLNISGVLSASKSGGLSGRQVTLHIEGAVTHIQTGKDGFFETSFQIPYVYKPSIKIYAEYIPKASDIGLFTASRSKTVEVKLLYLKANLTASLDKNRAKPMEECEVSGSIDPPDLKVWIEAFSRKRMMNPSPNGFFKTILSVPSDASESIHEVKVWSEARGVIAPKRLILKLEVYRLPLELKAYTPPLCFSGLGLNGSGSVSSSKSPMQDVKVTIEGITGKIETVTDNHGAFEAVTPLPLNLLSGSYTVRISASTEMPEYRKADATCRFTVVNPISAALPSALLLFFILRLKPRRIKSVVNMEAPIEAPLKPKKKPALKGIQAVYAEAVNIVERYTGIDARPNYTVREYLKVVSPILREYSKPFEEISKMLEDELYGGLKVDLEEAYKVLDVLRRNLIER